MAHFTDEFLDDLRARLPVSAVVGRKFKLRKEGRDHRAIDDNSLTVSDGKRLWWDQSKGVGGDIFKFEETYERCTFPEAVERLAKLAGVTVPNGSGAYANGHHDAHRGAAQQPSNEAEKTDTGQREIEATFDYRGADGALVMQVVRYLFKKPDGSYQKSKDGKRKKLHLQRRPDGQGGWIWKMDGVTTVPYRLPELIEAIADDKTVFVVEGEKKADALAKIGFAATCNPAGAGKWPPHFAEHFAGARVVIMPDNDDPGRKHAYQVGENLDTVAASVMLLSLPDLPPKGDVVDWIAEGGTAADLAELAGTARAWERETVPVEPFKSKFGLVMWADQDASGGDEYEYLIEDLVPQAEPVLIIGESQSGKSFLTTHMALCGARGVPFFGRRILKPFGVIYCAYEAGKGFRDRLRAYRRHHGLNLDALPFGVLTKPVNLWSDALSTNALIAEILQAADQRFRGVPLGAVVIDTHNAATPGMNEIDSKDISVIRDRYKAIMTATGAGCWIIGHKNAAGKHRGNEQLYNNIETAIDIAKKMTAERFPQMLRDADGRVLRHIKVIKQREGLDGEGWDFVLDQVEVGRDDKYGKPKTSCVPALPTVEERSGEPGTAKLTMQQKRFMEALFEGLDSYGGAPDSALGLPRSVVKVVDYSHVKKIFARRELNDGEDPRDHAGKLRTALSRARKELSARRVIGADNPFIWWSGRPIEGMSGTVTEARNAPVTPSETRTSGRTESGPDPDIDELFGR